MGEFGLIEHLTQNMPLKNAETLKGVGDDAAVLDYKDKQVLVTTDLLLEGVHFDLTYVPLKHLGYKSAVVNFSDIYAMNGQPKQITVSIGLSKRFSVEDMEELYSGIRLACDVYGVDLVGGDTSASLTGLAISITCIGEGEKGKVVYRSGAKETDWCVGLEIWVQLTWVCNCWNVKRKCSMAKKISLLIFREKSIFWKDN